MPKDTKVLWEFSLDLNNSANLIAFGFVALGMVLSPGPNMIYLISRSISQGKIAGLISLLGVGSAFILFLLCSALGVTVLIVAIPFAYDAIKFAGAIYLLYLAWQAVKPNGKSPFEVKALKPDSPKQLFLMGFLTNILNPKAMVLYISLLPQFIDPTKGKVFLQFIELGVLQMAISLSVNGIIVLSAAHVASFLAGKPFWIKLQRWLMGTVLAGLAIKIATEAPR